MFVLPSHRRRTAWPTTRTEADDTNLAKKDMSFDVAEATWTANREVHEALRKAPHLKSRNASIIIGGGGSVNHACARAPTINDPGEMEMPNFYAPCTFAEETVVVDNGVGHLGNKLTPRHDERSRLI